MTARAEPTWPSLDGPAALADLAPAVAPLIARLAVAIPAAGGTVSPAWGPQLCAETLGLAPAGNGSALPGSVLDWRSATGPADADRAALRFAEQFATDVAAIDDDTRAAAAGALGDRLFTWVMQLYLGDFVPRVRAALDALFAPPPDGWPGDADERAHVVNPWPAIEEFQVAVARQRSLDPTTTELVRLRGARAHHCRLCMSLRSRSALVYGAGEADFAAVDHWADSSLSLRHKAALALTDAMIWHPAHLDEAMLDEVRAHFGPAEAVEIVLDVMRNAGNKIAVALAADGAHVSEGIEVYDVDPEGTVHYGLTAP